MPKHRKPSRPRSGIRRKPPKLNVVPLPVAPTGLPRIAKVLLGAVAGAAAGAGLAFSIANPGAREHLRSAWDMARDLGQLDPIFDVLAEEMKKRGKRSGKAARVNDLYIRVNFHAGTDRRPDAERIVHQAVAKMEKRPIGPPRVTVRASDYDLEYGPVVTVDPGAWTAMTDAIRASLKPLGVDKVMVRIEGPASPAEAPEPTGYIVALFKSRPSPEVVRAVRAAVGHREAGPISKHAAGWVLRFGPYRVGVAGDYRDRITSALARLNIAATKCRLHFAQGEP